MTGSFSYARMVAAEVWNYFDGVSFFPPSNGLDMDSSSFPFDSRLHCKDFAFSFRFDFQASKANTNGKNKKPCSQKPKAFSGYWQRFNPVSRKSF
jgi:hypothetical protein